MTVLTLQIQNITEGLLSKRELLHQIVEKSFLPDEMKGEYKEILEKRFCLLNV